MARITVEDCIDKVDDRFELVAIAARRAKDISSGADLTIDRNDEKNTVLSLREIADENVSVEELRAKIVGQYQRQREIDDDLIVDDEGSTEATFSPAEELGLLESTPTEEQTDDFVNSGEFSFADDNLDDVAD